MYGSDVRFDEEAYKMCYSVMKFDESSKEMDKYEFTQLVNQVAKHIVIKDSFAITDVSSAKIHRTASAQALRKPTIQVKRPVSDHVKIRSQCLQLFKTYPNKAVFFKPDVLKFILQVFAEAGIQMRSDVIEA